MKHSKLKHSFDGVRLSDEKKREMLSKLRRSRSGRSPARILRPAMALGLVAMMLGGIYVGSQFLKNPRRSQGPSTAATTPEPSAGLPGLSVHHDTLVRLYEDTRYSISPEKWQKIRTILSRAIADPEINGVTMELRENDLNLTSAEKPYYFIREFREIYYMDEERFEAWHLSDGDASLLEEELQSVMQGGQLIDDPTGELSITPWLDRHHDTLRHPMTGREYHVSPEHWQAIRAILGSAHYEPDINAVTDDLREADLYLGGDFEQYLFLRDYREFYLMGSGLFAAYRLDDEGSAALQDIMSEVMTEENLNETPPVTEEPGGDLSTIPTLDQIHFRLSHPITGQEYLVSPEQWKVIREILLRAKHEPQWNAVTEELRESDLHLFNSSTEHLFLRDYQQIYLTGLDRFTGYSLSEEDSAQLKEVMETIMVPGNLYGRKEGPIPGDLPFLTLFGKDGETSWDLSEEDRRQLAVILDNAEYVATLGMVELIEAKEGQEHVTLGSEEPELSFTDITTSGDLFIESGLFLSIDTKRNYHYRLSPEATAEFFAFTEEVFARAASEKR